MAVINIADLGISIKVDATEVSQSFDKLLDLMKKQKREENKLEKGREKRARRDKKRRDKKLQAHRKELAEVKLTNEKLLEAYKGTVLKEIQLDKEARAAKRAIKSKEERDSKAADKKNLASQKATAEAWESYSKKLKAEHIKRAKAADKKVLASQKATAEALESIWDGLEKDRIAGIKKLERVKDANRKKEKANETALNEFWSRLEKDRLAGIKKRVRVEKAARNRREREEKATSKKIAAIHKREAAAKKRAMEDFHGSVKSLHSFMMGPLVMAFQVAAFAAAALGVAVLKVGSDFEKSIITLASIRGIDLGTAEGIQQMQDMEDTARQLGRTTLFTATEAADAMQALARAGMDANSILEVSGDALNFAGANATSMSNATQLLAATMAQFNLTSDKSTEVVDTFTGALQNSLLDVESLTIAMRYGGSVGAALGMSLKDTTTALALFRDLGLEGSIAGTQFRQAMLALSRPTARAQEALEKYGITMEEVNPVSNSFAEIMTTIGKANMKMGDIVSLVSKRAAGSIAQISKEFATASEESNSFNMIMVEIDKGIAEGLTKRTYEQQITAVSNRALILRSAFEELLITVFELMNEGGSGDQSNLGDFIGGLKVIIDRTAEAFRGMKLVIGTQLTLLFSDMTKSSEDFADQFAAGATSMVAALLEFVRFVYQARDAIKFLGKSLLFVFVSSSILAGVASLITVVDKLSKAFIAARVAADGTASAMVRLRAAMLGPLGIVAAIVATIAAWVMYETAADNAALAGARALGGAKAIQKIQEDDAETYRKQGVKIEKVQNKTLVNLKKELESRHKLGGVLRNELDTLSTLTAEQIANGLSKGHLTKIIHKGKIAVLSWSAAQRLLQEGMADGLKIQENASKRSKFFAGTIETLTARQEMYHKTIKEVAAAEHKYGENNRTTHAAMIASFKSLNTERMRLGMKAFDLPSEHADLKDLYTIIQRNAAAVDAQLEVNRKHLRGYEQGAKTAGQQVKNQIHAEKKLGELRDKNIGPGATRKQEQALKKSTKALSQYNKELARRVELALALNEAERAAIAFRHKIEDAPIGIVQELGGGHEAALLAGLSGEAKILIAEYNENVKAVRKDLSDTFAGMTDSEETKIKKSYDQRIIDLNAMNEKQIGLMTELEKEMKKIDLSPDLSDLEEHISHLEKEIVSSKKTVRTLAGTKASREVLALQLERLEGEKKIAKEEANLAKENALNEIEGERKKQEQITKEIVLAAAIRDEELLRLEEELVKKIKAVNENASKSELEILDETHRKSMEKTKEDYKRKETLYLVAALNLEQWEERARLEEQILEDLYNVELQYIKKVQRLTTLETNIRSASFKEKIGAFRQYYEKLTEVNEEFETREKTTRGIKDEEKKKAAIKFLENLRDIDSQAAMGDLLTSVLPQGIVDIGKAAQSAGAGLRGLVDIIELAKNSVSGLSSAWKESGFRNAWKESGLRSAWKDWKRGIGEFATKGTDTATGLKKLGPLFKSLGKDGAVALAGLAGPLAVIAAGVLAIGVVAAKVIGGMIRLTVKIVKVAIAGIKKVVGVFKSSLSFMTGGLDLNPLSMIKGIAASVASERQKQIDEASKLFEEGEISAADRERRIGEARSASFTRETAKKGVGAKIEAATDFATSLVAVTPAVLDALIAGLPKLFAAVSSAAPKVLSSLATGLPNFFRTAIEGAGGVIDAVATALPTIVKTFVSSISSNSGRIADAIRSIISNLHILKRVVEGSSDVLNQISGPMQKLIKSLIDAVSELLTATMERVVSSSAFEAVMDIFGNILQGILEATLGSETFRKAVFGVAVHMAEVFGKAILSMFPLIEKLKEKQAEADAWDEEHPSEDKSVSEWWEDSRLKPSNWSMFNDTPAPIRVGQEGLMASFAAGDYIIAAQQPSELIRQSLMAATNSIGSYATSLSAAAAGPPVVPPTYGGSAPIDIAIIAEGRLLDAVQITAMKRGHAPEMTKRLRRASGVTVGYSRGRFNKFAS